MLLITGREEGGIQGATADEGPPSRPTQRLEPHPAPRGPAGAVRSVSLAAGLVQHGLGH